jgi:hypothetical protein
MRGNEVYPDDGFLPGHTSSLLEDRKIYLTLLHKSEATVTRAFASLRETINDYEVL